MIAAWGNTIYYVGTSNGVSYTFGTVNSSGGTTTIATGLSLGGAEAPKLMFSPNGALYEFDVGPGGVPGAWGTINTATGVFTKVGSLDTAFGLGSYGPGGFNEFEGCSLAFGPSGALYATGPDIANNGSMDFGTLNLRPGRSRRFRPLRSNMGARLPPPSPNLPP